ncbi:cation-translocating P-type ATPase [Lactobacillus kefiranofaciens]|uniref:Plasma-membrane calcium-translocating P-type ATPase/potassium and/or sodium efflux P-type ATPase,TIGR01523 n=1 Tax=Lactobacillus kefiranofaciens TaxID=267818 RepID=A0ABY0MCJ3_9LACO|nr:cation-transporting P-type ATPase [Lactobacillus kefiranofaciens]KRM22721.1 H+-K+-exchanging ATPase [Lactobacillus kefiranofaciens subsp. kefiranofaciens DSM 5016 = JCM 6985]QFQ68206.1 cation-transporting P-type ATPase [Lactobacillus kefiranofaciens subsp. kefiranofaciens]SDA44709.1 plasma-membrane calcium-translocating P-type ATPase/potassium and/or sodium efflux P-type ATPase,TIGR01523 [Lactobacillus kefiranofaciens]
MDEKKVRELYAKASLMDVFNNLHSSKNGLSDEEAAKRLKKYGLNTIKKAATESEWRTFFKNFTSMMAILLWISGLIAIVSGTIELGIAIWLVNIINGLFSFWQEKAAKRATDALNKMLPTYVEVIRSGKKKQVDSKNLVPGDVFVLQAGNSIPADARILSASSMQVDQSALNGESVPESKTTKYDPGEGEYAESNLVYSGTTVGAGNARAIAFATGMNTEFGRIASLTQKQEKTSSPLTAELNRLTKQISIIAITIGVIFFIAAIFFVKYPLAKAFIFALGMIVAFIPEGLLPTVTLSLAQGVKRMAKKHALVKELNSVETLGETTVICSDKTGTLTQNQMTIHYLWTPAGEYQVTGNGYVNNGKVEFNKQQLWYEENPDLHKLVQIAALDNDTTVEPNKNGGKPKILGTPTEASLIVMAQKAGFDKQKVLVKYPSLRELPFDSERKRMSTIHRWNDTQDIIFTKGAYSDTIKQCDRIQVNGQVRKMTQADLIRTKKANADYASRGLRSMALAYRIIDQDTDINKIDIAHAEQHLIFVGLATMSDPPRPEIYDAVKRCHQAKIRIIMVTGDSKLTAKSVAVKIGITSDKARVISGTELNQMSDEELRQVLQGEVIFARVAPEQKYRIVKNCQANGEIVASTGDGVNDAPALKQADIGIAMGMTGTDVAKDAANMILTDDNFASIVAAIEEGRAVYSNIRKFLTYILTSNVPEAIPSVLFLFSAGLIPLPMTIMQILTVDLGTDMLPALGLGAEAADPDTMKEPPRKRSEHLLNKHVMIKAICWYGLISSLISTAAYFFVNYQNGWPQTVLAASGPVYMRATTMVLGAIVFTQIANVLNCRTNKTSVFKKGLFSNKNIWYGIIFEICLFFILTITPGIQQVFNTTTLAASDWLFLFLLPIPLVLLEEARKWLMYHKKNN